MALGCGAVDPEAGDWEQTEQAAVDPWVSPGKALLITSTSVVNDYYRTTDPCKNAARPGGQPTPPANAARKWSFGYLMTQMANQSFTGMSPSDFAMAWLEEWETHQRVNGDFLAPPSDGSNPPVPSTIKEQWLRRSAANGQSGLDMNVAPFRLLAIVNRFDLRNNPALKSGNAGELRFVFGVLNLDAREAGGQCGSMHHTGAGPIAASHSVTNVILEFAVDRSSAEVRKYAESWANLNALSQSSLDYRRALETITESVVRAGAGHFMGRANGSALNVLRTNESAGGDFWDFREFAIGEFSHRLHAQTVAQTPNAELNGSDDLGNWARYWSAEIRKETHNPPLSFQQDPSAASIFYSNTSFRGAHARSDQGHWHFNGDLELQFRFAKNTCNGCHASERLQLREAFHVMGRPFTQPAKLSHFLTGRNEDNTAPLGAADPRVVPPAAPVVRHFTELERRRQYLAQYLSGAPSSALAALESSSVH